MMGCSENIAFNRRSRLRVHTLWFAQNQYVRIPSLEGYRVIYKAVSRVRVRMKHQRMIEISDVG
jgi:hypothetical protein